MMKSFFPLIVLIVSVPFESPNDQGMKDPKPVAIFDGRTFEGWEGDPKIFRIEDNAIVGGSLREKIVRNEFLCTRRSYGDFELRLKVKLLGGDAANA